MRVAAPRSSRRLLLHEGLALVGLGLLSGCGAFATAGGRRAGVRRVGWQEINAATVEVARAQAEQFRDELLQLRYVEVETLTFEWRYADGHAERLADLAAGLVGVPVNGIVVNLSTPAALGRSGRPPKRWG